MNTRRNRPVVRTIKYQDFSIRVERPAGTVVDGVGVYTSHYGFFSRAKGDDGDNLDAFVGAADDASVAYLIAQLKDGAYDQVKVMLGYPVATLAREAFLAHRPAAMYGGMRSVTIAVLREQIDRAGDGVAELTGEIVEGEVWPEDYDGPPSTPGCAAAPTDTEACNPDEKTMENTNEQRGGGQERFDSLIRQAATIALGSPELDADCRRAVAAILSRSGSGGAPAPADSGVSRPDGLRMRAINVSAVREADREADWVASTSAVDSHGEVVRQNWRLDRYRSNPVILWAHDSSGFFMPPGLPIGRATRVVVEAGQLLITVRFATAKANPFAELCWQSVLEETLRGGSVGFVPHKVSREEIAGVMRAVLDDNELYEFSLCPIPSNPQGLIAMESALKKMVAAASPAPITVAPTTEIPSPAARAAVPYHAYKPVASTEWDGDAAVEAWRKACSSDGSGSPDTIDWSRYKEMFAWYDAASPEKIESYKLPHHLVVSGELVTSRAGVIAAGNAVMGARGGVDIPETEMPDVKGHLSKHYQQFDMAPPWEAEKAGAAGHEDTMKRIAITKEAFDKLLTEKGTLTIHCGACNMEMGVDMPMVMSVVEESAAAVSAKNTAEQAAADALSKKAVAEKERDDARRELTRLQLNPFVGIERHHITPALADTYADLAVKAPDSYASILKELQEKATASTTSASASADNLTERTPPTRLPDPTPNTAGRPIDSGMSEIDRIAAENLKLARVSQVGSL